MNLRYDDYRRHILLRFVNYRAAKSPLVFPKRVLKFVWSGSIYQYPFTKAFREQLCNSEGVAPYLVPSGTTIAKRGPRAPWCADGVPFCFSALFIKLIL